ncbi:hydroxymyristoyl-ACP dehydratase [Telmatospirillum siberiense]|uniref:Hydroxymyristoyl-ACP dehydratase n=1 Tax=Telmatospirillum siberiense TaxID=382514 RepID=A0A2N3PW01_9PROT|nr:hydroxymyristoyl-ACP dehydratase [Telmatospirillum siberiense]PKU24593.1 hydroxymyristoyl-ACP dehydratase [Telmatospirillum siberiense]
MTIPDIVSCQRPDESSVVLAFRLSAGAAAFDGHFPGHPILPGVLQLDWALRLAERYFGLEPAVGRDFQIKFRHAILPEADVILSLRLDAGRRLDLEYRVGEVVASTGRVRLG